MPASNRRVVVVVGLLALAVGAWSGLSALRFVASSVPTTGVIVARGGSSYTARFEVEGRSVQLQSRMPSTRGFARSRIQVGRPVAVRYDPADPARARVAGSALWFFPAVMTFIGVVGIVSGFVRVRT